PRSYTLPLHGALPISVAVFVSPDEGMIQLDIADRGRTLTPYERQHVFDSFYRGDSARGTRGAGLGLAITQAVARAHEATLQVLPDRKSTRLNSSHVKT